MQIQDKMDQLATSLKELLTDHKTFSGDIVGKGLVWTDGGPTKQFLFNVNPDRFLSTENLDLGKDKSYHINGDKVLSHNELGTSIVKSSLEEVGTLRGLLVSGDASLSNTVYISKNGLGIGTDSPRAPLNIRQGDIELTVDQGNISTVTNHDISLSAGGSSASIRLSPTGTISLGDSKGKPVQATVHGKLSVGVSVPDPEVDLHVAGPIKFEGQIHRYNIAPPKSGYNSVGDIIWNSQPMLEHYVGWVCIVAGNPGRWEPFGKIGNQ